MPLPANYDDNHNTPFLAVGSEPDGNGRWGHADLGGSVYEWVLDCFATDWYTTTEAGCADCANLTGASNRVGRGGYWSSDAGYLRTAYRGSYGARARYRSVGFRCSRSAP